MTPCPEVPLETVALEIVVVVLVAVEFAAKTMLPKKSIAIANVLKSSSFFRFIRRSYIFSLY
jgi:hypothetical protein